MATYLPGAIEGDAVLSYLPYAHVMEQSVFCSSLVAKIQIGYYCGDPLRLVEDCQLLKPIFFVSVPRLYNRIYSKIKESFGAATGCKKWLIDQGVSSKLAALNATGEVKSACYDSIIFSKTAAILGGKMRLMACGGAPIEQAVLDFLAICFSCPFGQGYGLTETGGSGCGMK